MRTLPEKPVIRYGAEEHALRLPGRWQAEWLEPPCPPPDGPAEAVLRRALDQPIASPRLRDLARGKRSAAIMVPGQDRVAAADVYLPLLLEELNAGGIADEAIQVFLATGTHAKHTQDEIVAVLGEEAARRVRWRQHKPNDPARLASLGTTSRGTPVLFERDVVEADVKVLTGRIIPHYFAGFGGGRKALLPGVASFDTIVHNHGLTLAPERGIHPCVRPCSLAGNPVHLDMVEAARRVSGHFVLNTLLDTAHRVVGAVAGELEAAHEAGCARATRAFQVRVAEPFDAVIASAGGAPYDCNFMQALKTAFDVEATLRPGGSLLWIAQSAHGMHDGFLRWAEIADDAELDRAVRAGYNLTGHNSILLRRLVRKARVALWSELPDGQVRALGLQPIHSLAEGLSWLEATQPGARRVGVAPFANVTHVALAGREEPERGDRTTA